MIRQGKYCTGLVFPTLYITVVIKHLNSDCYRPQRSWAKVIFSQACVKNSVHRGGVSASVHAGIHPQTRPPSGTRHPPGADPPGPGPPLGPGTPPRADPPDQAPRDQAHPQEQTPPGPGTLPRADTPGNRPPRPGTPPPPGSRHPPGVDPPTTPGKQTAAYGQRAAGTHPTGMHSCFLIVMIRLFIKSCLFYPLLITSNNRKTVVNVVDLVNRF